jgi:nitroreductase
MPVLEQLRDYLLARRSTTLPFLADPGPTQEELREMLTIATRVPDHGKLAPWRLITYAGAARDRAGDLVGEIFAAQNPGATDDEIDFERKRFLPAPLTVGVVSCAKPHPKIPEFEQLLSAGNVAFNLCHAAAAFGYGAHWVTRWFAYDEKASLFLGARGDERFVGFVHIGTPTAKLEDRDRPALEDVVTAFGG